MASYLVERFGAGKYKVGSVVELSSGEAALYASKVRRVEDPEKPKLEVATPKRTRRKKAQQTT